MSGTHRTRPRRALTGRGKAVAAAITVMLVTAAVVGYFTLFPSQAPAFVRQAIATVGLVEAPPPPTPTCPLTGDETARGVIPDRPALAVKIENAPESRPQASLNDADVVVEEPVEGGYTRFIAIFHCGASSRVGPVRSARTTDPDVLRQYGVPLFAYSGAAEPVSRAVSRVELVDVNVDVATGAYTRDDARVAPHNLYTTTAALWKAGRGSGSVPEPVFAFDDEWTGSSKRASSVHLPYSNVSDVHWSWSRRAGAWLRSHGDVPHELEDGSRVSATNVVIQVVDVTASSIVDAAGNASPDVALTGSGKAWVLRDGRLIRGRWERESLGDLTRFVSRDGAEIALAPGRTWIELVPGTVEITSSH